MFQYDKYDIMIDFNFRRRYINLIYMLFLWIKKQKIKKNYIKSILNSTSFLFKFSIVKYINYVLWSSWCNDNWVLFVINIINMIVALFRKSLYVFYYQFSICISLNIFYSLSLYFRTESYVILLINNWWLLRFRHWAFTTFTSR